MATIKKAQFGRLFNKAGAKMVQSAAKKSIKKSTPAAMSPFERDISAAISQVERAEMKKKLQAIERKMQGEDILKSVGKKKQRNGGKTPAWQRKEGKDPSGGLNAKGVASYRRANPGSKLKTAVTTKPSKLKPGSKAANRRKSFCARMSGMKKRLTSAKTANDPNSRINKSLRKWNC